MGSLDRVKQIVRIDGFVQSGDRFYDQPKVIDGASEFLLEVFGDAGKHTRMAIGADKLPLSGVVEVGAIFEVE